MAISVEQEQEQVELAVFIWQMSTLGDPYAQVLLRQMNPYRFFEKAREHGPIHRSRVGPWVTPDYRISRSILRDTRFGTRDVNGERTIAQFTSVDDSFLKLDPPDHTRLRRLVTPYFGARRFQAGRPQTEALCQELLDRALERAGAEGRFDVVTDYARPLMSELVCDVFGVRGDFRDRFASCSARVGRVFEGYSSPEQFQELEDAVAELKGLLRELVEIRAQEPGQDVVSGLLRAHGEERLTVDEVIGVCSLLSIAGTESTSHLIGNAVHALLENREQWQLLCDDIELTPRAVEETLRYDPPNHLISRVAHAEVELAGQRIAVGDTVVIMTGGANRDPQVYPEPGRFDILREDPAEPLTFSAGIHFCLGAALARTAAETALRVLVDRLPELRPSGPVRRRRSPSVRGLESLPVTVR
ncbi:cytochrome P450 [Streptomyces sp. SID13726]|uniref:cytochrome P450 n=1 Tax=Streptomyces sp. SID13726 TaxID=2706058 RepID=UPI0013BA88A8|nr:cytochrome P450 [Streptomyces sp. SID13726]NEA99073.1 cytochrome P450 [Streptomyces sp. SID13726]